VDVETIKQEMAEMTTAQAVTDHWDAALDWVSANRPLDDASRLFIREVTAAKRSRIIDIKCEVEA